MSGSVANCVKNVINRSPFISEMLIQDVISFSNLAKSIQPKVEDAYGESVNTAALIKARSFERYALYAELFLIYSVTSLLSGIPHEL